MICVTGCEKDLRSLTGRLARCAAFPLQEVRLDALPKLPTSRSALPVDPRRLIATCRRKKDHGLFQGPEEKRIQRLIDACALGFGWIDVEADLPESAFHRLRDAARVARTRILRSLHLGCDAGNNEIQGAFTLLARSPGDAIKLAASFNDTADLELLRRAPEDRPAVLVGSGPAGILTRALYNRFGSAWTYIAADAATAPLPDMPDQAAAELIGMPVPAGAPLLALIGGSSILGSPGPQVYNRLFRSRGVDGCYLPAVTGRLPEAFALLERIGLAGASVTIPHKMKAVGLVHQLDEGAQNARSVNTIYRMEDRWHGANTDVDAISVLAARLGGQSGQRALVLGTGGFARAGAWALADLGVRVVLLGRSLVEEAGPWEDCLPLSALCDVPFHILFNATPLGGNGAAKCPVGRRIDLQGKIVIDGVLGPKATPLVRRAAREHARVGTGVDLWAEQGARQLDLFGCPRASAAELRDLALQTGKVASAPAPAESAARKAKPNRKAGKTSRRSANSQSSRRKAPRARGNRGGAPSRR